MNLAHQKNKSRFAQIMSVERVTPYIKKLRYFLYARFFLGLKLALDAPEDILTNNPFLQQFTTLMKGIVPYIGRTAARSVFPQVTELYLSISWALSPLYLIYDWGRYYCGMGLEVKRTLAGMNKRPASLWRCLWNIVLIILLFSVFIGYFFYFGGYNGRDFIVAPINTSRTALGLIGWLLAGGGVIIIAHSLWLVTSRQVKWFFVLIREKK
ncbi:MAG: hypothetical protein LBU46_05980 [Candidatus Accumulibacter sp.]|nr:hypothetical protein [Accumulibacter sp.]